jgi:hypothetical protein
VRLTAIKRITGFRSLADVGPLELGDITLFIGPNNSGKSSILHAVLALQANVGTDGRHVRLGERVATVSLHAEAAQVAAWGPVIGGQTSLAMNLRLDGGGGVTIQVQAGGGGGNVPQLPAAEPNHVFVPFLSRRRPDSYAEDVSMPYALGVHPDMRFLAAKLSRIAQPAHPQHEAYAVACREIVGQLVTAVPSQNGQLPGVFVGTSESILLADMGAGVAQVVGLLADLALSEGKVFVLEEPENDLHPAALRALLDLIAHASERNQFLVSTHSNLVLRHLGSRAESRIYRVTADDNWPPNTSVREVAPEPAARSELLVELGYELRDLELYDAWLFLEEASAESIVERLVHWFTPDLVGRLRTVSARGVSRVRPTFDDFTRLMVFAHLEPRYRDRAWVLVDGDGPGRETVESLRETYSGTWRADRFRALREQNVERYYPSEFVSRVDAILAVQDRHERRAQKHALVREVLAWIDRAPEDAKTAFESSAAEIIDLLREIEQVVCASS